MSDKKLKLPEVGQWPDKLVAPALIAGAVLSTVGFLMAFFYVAPVGGATVNGAELIGDVMVSQKLLLSQKIFYFHMPVAITSFIALGFGCYYAVRFLMTKNQRFDTCSRICLEIALLFVALTMITGEMWTRFEWGVWWSWEPRLTTYLILMLIVIAYFVLRSSVDEPERRGDHHRHHRRAHLLHDHPADPLVHPPRGAARGRHEPGNGPVRGPVRPRHAVRRLRAVSRPLQPGAPHPAGGGPERDPRRRTRLGAPVPQRL